MEVFMKGEDGLRQSDRKGFGKTASPKSPYTDSGGFDFGDVFGGPPRQFMMRGCGAVGEEPVFGVARRRHLQSDDFFDDIFRGDERTHYHRSSFPAKSTKLVVEFPTFSSRNDHVEYKMDKSSKRFSNDKSGVLRFEVHQSPFCEEAYSPYATSHRNDDVPKLTKDLKSIDSHSDRYHFIADNLKGDFATRFNKEADLKQKTYANMQTQSCRWTAAGVKQMENDNQVNESLRKVEPQQWPSAKTPSYASKDTFSSEPPRSDSKILGEDSDDPFEDFFELHDDLEQATPRSEACEDTKADAKIRQWSAGKEGNIRSLLSTLQYVLWPGSEWQPIALVDLVEENQVKRAYQKALLRLHPDKLQQKGAASHHKYIALRVFDILQDAWDHFNNIGPI